VKSAPINYKNMRAQNSFFKFIYQHLLTIVSCVLIVALGIVYLAYSSPGTTTIGEDISTTNLTITNNLSVGNNATTTGNLNVLGNFSLEGIATMLSNLSISGNTSISQNLSVSGTSTLSTTTISGTLGVGTTTPSYTLDVAGNIRATKSLTAGINVETLSADKTLTPGIDAMYQYLDEGGANRVITLATTTAKAGDRFIIRHNGAYSDTHHLEVKQGNTTLDYISAGAIKKFIFDGTNWISAENGTGENNNKTYNVAIGYNAKAYFYGTAVGYYVHGHDHGAALGRFTYGFHYGAAVGAYAKGIRYGAALGYMAGRNIDSAEDRYNTLVGAYSGYQITTGKGNVILGYGSGYDSTYSPTTGSYNILIGYQSWTPATTTSNFLNIGGLIFGTNLATTTNTISTGNVGIGTTTPAYKLQVAGDIAPTSDNAYDLGKSNLRWANLYAASTTVGDLIFNNNFRIVETKPNETIQALMVRNQNGEEVIRINEKGEISSQSINTYNLNTYNFYAQNPIFGTPAHPTGITIYDRATGKPYCLYIENDKLIKQKGECK